MQTNTIITIDIMNQEEGIMNSGMTFANVNHYQRAYNRDWHHARRIYIREELGYARVIPTYGYNNLHPGSRIQFGF